MHTIQGQGHSNPRSKNNTLWLLYPAMLLAPLARLPLCFPCLVHTRTTVMNGNTTKSEQFVFGFVLVCASGEILFPYCYEYRMSQTRQQEQINSHNMLPYNFTLNSLFLLFLFFHRMRFAPFVQAAQSICLERFKKNDGNKQNKRKHIERCMYMHRKDGVKDCVSVGTREWLWKSRGLVVVP